MNDQTVDPIDENEPLGYHQFLCDVNIEYSPGGTKEHSANNRHCFKLKCLPYLMVNHHNQPQHRLLARKNSFDSSICDNQSSQDDDSASPYSSRHLDVTKTTCAFLGNSDYVPKHQFDRRRVILELISAKLSQPTAFNVPINHRISPIESTNQSTSNSTRTATSSSSNSSHPNTTTTTPNHYHSPLANSTPTITTSKRFVNYTLLIKTAPGLDRYPAVIERRFSDFLQLYQGLKSQEPFSKIVDKQVTFPKKVYMGNFSLVNIAERSIEFSRLLTLCMLNIDILWSTPFISFLIDKELKEAHRLSLVGDPDDVQAFIETAYHILRKLYLKKITKSTLNSSSSSIMLDMSSSEGYSLSTPPNENSIIQIDESLSQDEAITGESSCSLNSVQKQTSSPVRPVGSNNSGEHFNLTPSSTSDDPQVSPPPSACLLSLNQRILVTFCILFLTYYRGKNFKELKLAVGEFSQLISTQEFVDSLANTRHFTTLRACLLFLMNMNEGNVIEDGCRLLLKRKLEDIDGAQVGLEVSQILEETTNDSPRSNGFKNKKEQADNISCNSHVYRVTNRDLSSLLRDRSFCTFQESN